MSINHGSGSRVSGNYQISSDIISAQPTGSLTSQNFNVNSGAVSHYIDILHGGVYIDGDQPLTNSTSVSLGLICSDPSGCSEASISNNGVGWSEPQAYSTFTSWELPPIDGTRTVYVKYKNNSGEWSGSVSDSIVLDAKAPNTTISPTSGTYMAAQNVTITASEESSIHYSTDGSAPSESSDVYTAPVSIATDSTLMAYSIDPAGNSGPVVSESYVICTGSNMSISGQVKDARLDEGMPLVTVTLNSGQSTLADANGNYSFTGLPRGYYNIESITTAQAGYVTFQDELMLCKSSIIHDISLTTQNTTFGTDTSSGYSADSVNTSSGNYVYSVSDLAITGRGIPFEFTRTYNSQDDSNGPLGYGWTHNYNISMSEDGDGNIILRWGDGKIEVWAADGSGGYTPMYGVFNTLIKNGDNTFTVRQKNLTEYHFDLNRKLVAIEDENANQIQFNYIGDQLTTITDTVGKIISFSYDASNRITRILDPVGRSVTFTYDVDGNMVSAADLAGAITTYTYNDNNQILTITDPLGNVVITVIYDDQRRVVSSQRDALGGQILYSYDTVNKVTQIVDPYGNTSYHHFDALLRLTKEIDAFDQETIYVYDERGNIVSVKDKNGHTTSFTYDADGNILVKADPLGNESSATYNVNHNPLTKTDANGNVTSFTYDAQENLLTVTDALGNVTSSSWDSHGQLLSRTNALENVTSYEYDTFGNQVAVIDALGNRSTFVYDGVGRKLNETHPLGRAAAYEYDNMDRLIAATDALGHTSRFSYDGNGNKTEHIDAEGNKTLFAYDAKDRLITTTTPGGETEHFTWDLMDRRIRVTNPLGAITTVQYDPLGNLITSTDAMGNVIRNSYDANGNKVGTTDARGYITSWTYDPLNRPLTVTNPLGQTVTTTYDANGNVLTVTDNLDNRVTKTWDALNRLVMTTDPLGNTTTYEYDVLGRLVKVINGKGVTTFFEYNELGYLVRVTDGAGGEVSATYDLFGNRLTLTDTLGSMTTYTYDKLNRLLEETDSSGNSTICSYDNLGSLQSLSNSRGTFLYAYDLNNRLTAETLPSGSTITHTYDAAGNKTSITDSAGTTTFSYNILSQIESINDPFGISAGYTYDPNGNRSSTRYPGNRTVYYLYDSLNRLASVQDWQGVKTTYQYDDNGRVASKVMGNGTVVSFTYDKNSRLLAKTDRDKAGQLLLSHSYTLDEVGNKTGLEVEQPLLPGVEKIDELFTHNSGHQVTDKGSVTYSYDSQGGRVSRDEGTESTSYSYNDDDLLTRVEKGSDVWEYQYNSGGHRLASVKNGEETRFLLDLNGGMDKILAEMDETNQVLRYYIHGDGLLYSIDATTGEHLYYHYDPQGSTLALSDSEGAVTDSYAYLPYGERAGHQGIHENPFTFVGQYGVMEEGNDLYFMRARFYDPETRRFMSKDPVMGDMKKTQILSPYPYVESNPLSLVDPKGEYSQLVFAGLLIGGSYLAMNYVVISQESPETETIWDDVLSVITGQILDKLTNGLATKFTDLLQNLSPVDEKIESTETEQYLKHDSTTSKLDLVNTTVVKRNKPPKNYLDVARSAQKHFNREFSKLTNPNFVDDRTRSYIEMSISQEIIEFQNRRYGYRTKEKKREQQQRLERDVQQSANRLYARLASALSKHAVLIQDLEKLPTNNQAVSRRGIYAQ